MAPTPISNRLKKFIKFTPTCWEWQGAVSGRYGQITVGKRKHQAHRFVYELLLGPIPDGLTLDHLCFNKLCVNPGHLEPCTTGENTRRWYREMVTHCPRGHVLEGVRPDNGRRYCKVCERERGRRKWAGRKAALESKDSTA